MKRFVGKVAIVSGASSGIGRAVAERLGSEGAKLVLLAAPTDEEDLKATQELLGEAGVEAIGLAADVAEEETAERAVSLALESFGGLDVLVSNAGIAFFEEIFDTPVAHLDRTFAVNVRGTFLLSVAAARAMAHRSGGAISTTVSSAAQLGEEFQVTYNVSKAAIASLTRSLAVDLAPYGVRVNGVSPGWVRTRSTAPVIASVPEWTKYRSRIPMDRAATPEEIAAAHAFLVSDDASYVTGAIVAADGGLTAGLRWSNWAAVEDARAPLPVGIPAFPETLGRPTDP